jgi:F0F1-type ATP synthase membrane subunit b/b'
MHNLIELNTNILETNLINILLLLGLLVYVNKTSFSLSLKERQNEISQNLAKVEKDIFSSLKFYEKSELNLKLSHLYVQEWRNTYEKEKIAIVESKYGNVKESLSQIFLNTESLFESFESKTTANLQKYLVLLATGKLLRKFFFLSKEKKSKIINEIIFNLEEKIGG